MDFEKFDKKVDLKGLKNDLAEAEKNNTNFDKVPYGQYEVSIEKMELTESKKGDPMFTCWFKILSGDFKDRLIFMNQLLVQGFQLHIVNTFLRSLDTGLDIKFDSYVQYNQLILDVAEKIDSDCTEFGLEYGQTSKGFDTFNIVEIFDNPL